MKGSFADALPRGSGGSIRPARASRGKVSPNGGRAVQRSAELKRVLSLPRRDLQVYDKAFAAALSQELRKEGSTFELRVKQAPMLVEAVEAGGLFGMVPVGEGKSVVAPLFGKVLDVAPVVLLVPPAMKLELQQKVIPWLKKEIDFVPPIVVSYAELSTAGKDDILERIKPAAIVCDEVHNLKYKSAARTKRFLRYFDEHPDTILIALSGTIARRSLMDFHHIIMLTHKLFRCPVTRQWREAKDWSLALDPQVPGDQRLRPGALLELCRPGEDARDGFRRRLMDTEGVVGGASEEVGASLIFREYNIDPLPPVITQALKDLRKSWELPARSGEPAEQITDALDFHRRARELAQGFYYVWDWPNGKPDEAWLMARAEWRAAVSAICRLNRPGLDSELLVRNAVKKGEGGFPKKVKNGQGDTIDVVLAWQNWSKVMHREEPATRAVWLSDWYPAALVAWARDKVAEGGGIAWCDSRAVEERCLDLLDGKTPGVFVCGAGDKGNARLLELAGSRAPASVIASATAHGTGKNLQRWSNMLIPLPWSGGADWDQRVGRIHRPGQEADEVNVEVWAHTEELRESIATAKEQAKFIEETTGAKQKLLFGTWVKA